MGKESSAAHLVNHVLSEDQSGTCGPLFQAVRMVRAGVAWAPVLRRAS